MSEDVVDGCEEDFTKHAISAAEADKLLTPEGEEVDDPEEGEDA